MVEVYRGSCTIRSGNGWMGACYGCSSFPIALITPSLFRVSRCSFVALVAVVSCCVSVHPFVVGGATDGRTDDVGGGGYCMTEELFSALVFRFFGGY